MDYTKIPRRVVYKDRSDLSEFEVKTEGTLNHYLFNQMRRMTLLRCGNAQQIALQCLNNAYYICTLIQLEEYPDTCMDSYQKALLNVDIPFKNDVYQASMALVCVLLAAYDDQYRQKDNLLIESIHHWTSHGEWMNAYYHKSFLDIIEACSPEGLSLPSDAFAPRDIIDVLDSDDVEILARYPEYICVRLSLLDDSRRKKHATDLAIARLEEVLNTIYEDYGYDPKTKSFKEAIPGTYSAEPEFEDDFKEACEPVKEAIDYIKSHRQSIMDSVGKSTKEKEGVQNPKAVVPSVSAAEETQLKNRISELSNKLKKQEEENKQLSFQLEELNVKLEEALTLPEDITAKQKVRMETVLQLLERAGLKTEGGYPKSKVATLISFITGIRSNNKRGANAQICANYLTDRNYYPDQENQDTLIRLNQLFAELRIDVSLKLSSDEKTK